MMNDFRDRISHADYHYSKVDRTHKKDNSDDLTEFDIERLRGEDLAGVARNHLEARYPDNSRNDELSHRLAGLLNIEQSRRNAHYYRYRAMLRIAADERLFDEQPRNVAEASLSEFYRRISSLDEQGLAFAKILGGKGISAELAHVDQLGDWQSGKVLDEAIRELPHSDTLADEGFLFGETYDLKSNAQLDYKFQLADMTGNKRGLSIKGVRKRAAADILAEDGSLFEIVKLSTFLVDVKELDDHQRASLGQTLRLQSAHDYLIEKRADKGIVAAAAISLDESAQETGDAVIEHFISQAERRERSTALLAATSLYFALYRHR